jgi:hypothetical protein
MKDGEDILSSFVDLYSMVFIGFAAMPRFLV